MSKYNMSYDEALELARTTGAKIAKRHFTSEEYFAYSGGRLVDEQGYSMARWYRNEPWQNEGWCVWESPVNSGKE